MAATPASGDARSPRDRSGAAIKVIIGLVVVFVGARYVAWHFKQARWNRIHERAEPLLNSAEEITLAIPEPSGVAYHPLRKTLIFASDQGVLFETDLAFKVLSRHVITGDLEGVAVHPASGRVFIASESAKAILEYDLDQRRVTRTIGIDFASHPDFSTELERNKGLEGVTIVESADGGLALYAVVEDRPARLIQLDADIERRDPPLEIDAEGAAGPMAEAGLEASLKTTLETQRIVNSFDLDVGRLSGLTYDRELDRVLAISSKARVLLVCTTAGRVVRTLRLPGKKLEGLCLLPNGDAIVTQDSGGGWVIKNLRDTLKTRK